MKPIVAITIVAAAALPALAGCSFHRSPIQKWHFFDAQTRTPIDDVLLLEWNESTSSRSPEVQAFEQQVPAAASLTQVRAAMLTVADPAYRSDTKTSFQGIALTVSQRSRYMAIHGDYAFTVKFAGQEELADLPADTVADASVAYVLLTRRPDATVAVDWLHWLANGRDVLRRHLTPAQSRRVYESFAAYWQRTLAVGAANLKAELDTRPASVARELERIYHAELGKPAPPM